MIEGKKNTVWSNVARSRILEEDVQRSYYYPKACRESKFISPVTHHKLKINKYGEHAKKKK